MVTLTTRRNSEAAVIDPDALVISIAIIADMLISEELPGTFTPVRRDNLLLKMLKSVEAFYGWLSGPPMPNGTGSTRKHKTAREGGYLITSRLIASHLTPMGYPSNLRE